jgi:hypothetical protein
MEGERREPRRTGEAAVGKNVVVRAAVALAFVAAVCSATGAMGPRMGGTIAAFPAMSGSLALLVHRASGAQAAVGVLRGLVHGLGGYFAFAATVALLAPSPLAVPAGMVACAVAGRAVRTSTRNAQERCLISDRVRSPLSAWK